MCRVVHVPSVATRVVAKVTDPFFNINSTVLERIVAVCPLDICASALASPGSKRLGRQSSGRSGVLVRAQTPNYLRLPSPDRGKYRGNLTAMSAQGPDQSVRGPTI